MDKNYRALSMFFDIVMLIVSGCIKVLLDIEKTRGVQKRIQGL